MEAYILIVFGDNLKNDTGMRGHVWQNCYEGWSRFAKKANDAGGNTRMIHLPDMGIRGNSHMMMEDKNSHQIADIVLDWCKTNKVIANSNEMQTNNNYLTSYNNSHSAMMYPTTMNIQEINGQQTVRIDGDKARGIAYAQVVLVSEKKVG